MIGRAGASLAALVVLAALAGLAPEAAAIKLVTWNITNYPVLDLPGRQPDYRTVMAAIDPDVVILQELNSSTGRDSFLTNVLNVVQPGQWANGGFIQSTESAILYKPSKVSIVGPIVGLGTAGPRDVLIARVRPVGYVSNTASFLIYSVHLKAGNPMFSPGDSTTRRLECTDIRNSLNNLAPGTHFVVGGDYNFYGSWEAGYIRLTESQPDNDGRCQDPIVGMTGTWNDGFYAAYHTQSPCADCPYVDFSGGGMDDRFDLWLPSTTMFDGEGIDLVPGSYTSFGNDGLHYNDDINAGGFNGVVPLAVADALWGASDHLPVVITIQRPAKVAAASQLDFGTVIVGATAEQSLVVSDPAILPADELSYTLSAPAGFTAPAGPFAAQAQAAGNAHTLGMNTATAGTRNGALIVASDDPDSSAKPVQLSGRVLDHAAASLDSTATVTAGTLNFGYHPAGGFTDLDLRVHNLGWDPLQARLVVGSHQITGGASRFSLVGGFQSATLSGVGHTYTVHFDDAGATPDSSYSATLTFDSADEALPGATAAANLVLTLSARVTTGPVAADPAPPPTALRLAAPRPNPLKAGETVFGFELPRATGVDLALFDAAGRRVATLVAADYAAGRWSARWDGRDASGRRAPAGVYLARLITALGVRNARLVLLP